MSDFAKEVLRSLRAQEQVLERLLGIAYKVTRKERGVRDATPPPEEDRNGVYALAVLGHLQNLVEAVRALKPAESGHTMPAAAELRSLLVNTQAEVDRLKNNMEVSAKIDDHHFGLMGAEVDRLRSQLADAVEERERLRAENARLKQAAEGFELEAQHAQRHLGQLRDELDEARGGDDPVSREVYDQALTDLQDTAKQLTTTLADLERFRKREEKVTELFALLDGVHMRLPGDVNAAWVAVRDFKVTP